MKTIRNTIILLLLFIQVSVSSYGNVIKVASVQMPITGDIQENLKYIKNAINEIKKTDTRLIVFPETALTGIFEENVKNIDWDELRKSMDTIALLAKENDIYIVYGTATQSHYERPYNSALVINPQGECIEIYHKNFPENHFQSGNRLALFSIDGIPATLIICHDSRYPELVRVPVMAGARICLYLSYEINPKKNSFQKKDGYRAQSMARAVENNIWYIQANGVGPFEGDLVSLGNSIIVDGNGNIIANAPEMEPAILYSDIAVDMTKPQYSTAHRGKTGTFLGDWNKAALEQLYAQKMGDEFSKNPKAADNSVIRLALMQDVPEKWNVEKNFNTFLKLLDETKDSDFFITPECWLDGYAASDETSTVIKLKTIAQKLDYSPYLKRISEEAKKRNMYICFGFTSLENGKIYNSTGLWDKTGKLIGIYHKTHLQTHDLQFEEGDDLPVWNTEWGKVGMMICADGRCPETARTLQSKGARLIINPTYGMYHLVNEWRMRTKGFENQCFIAFSHPNVGFVVNPKGDLMAKRIESPGVLICDIDLTISKNDGHIRDRRPDIYHKDEMK